jgi:hypothetical protein
VHRDDVLGAGVEDPPVHGGELGRRGTRGGDRHAFAQRPGDVRRRDVDAVRADAIADRDPQRHHSDPEVVGDVRRQVRRGVGDDGDARPVRCHEPRSFRAEWRTEVMQRL